jgi:hypothetical protein
MPQDFNDRVDAGLRGGNSPLTTPSLDLAIREAIADANLATIFRVAVDQHVEAVVTQIIKHWVNSYFANSGIDDQIRDRVREQLNDLFKAKV